MWAKSLSQQCARDEVRRLQQLARGLLCRDSLGGVGGWLASGGGDMGESAATVGSGGEEGGRAPMRIAPEVRSHLMSAQRVRANGVLERRTNLRSAMVEALA